MRLSEYYKGALISGEFFKSKTGTEWIHSNPFHLDEVYFSWFEDESLVSKAINAGHEAFRKWKLKGISERASLLKKLAELFAKNESLIGELIARETGKAIWEAKAEASALSSKIRISLDIMLPAVQALEKIGFQEKRQYMRFKPRGLCAVLGPFNFPLHLANGHIVPALLAGNTVIFKPSEFSPTCASFYSSLIQEAGFPSGVFQCLPGGASTGKKLVESPYIRGVFFTGSYAVGRSITQNLLQTRPDLDTLAALEMGGKNATIVHEDADIKKAVAETWMSAYVTAGQRCACTSRVFVHTQIYSEFKKYFLEGIKQIKIGDPLDPENFMGPMIHEKAMNSFFEKLQQAQNQGLKALVDSKKLKSRSCLSSPSIYESENPETDTQTEALKEEFFGPHCVLIPYRSIEELIDWHERAPYGLVTSVFSKSQSFIDKLDQEIEVGLFNINRGTVGASSQLPFGGRKKSGNNWPAGIFSYFYCVSPRSYLEEEPGFESTKLPASLQSALETLK